MVLAFEVMDRERLLAAAALLSSRVIDTATVERHSWARQRMATFFPDIVGTWDDSEFKCNFRVSRGTFQCLCSELQPVLGMRYVVRKPVSVQQRIAMTLWRLGTNVEYRTINHLFGVGLSSVCAIGHEVCEAIVTILGHRYIRIMVYSKLWMASSADGNSHNVQEL